MRNFFVKWMERLLGLMVILSVLALLLTVIWNVTQGSAVPGLYGRAAVILALGFVSIIMTFGFAYIALGIHANTLRTAEALEAMARGTESARTGAAPSVQPPVGASRRTAPPLVQNPVKPDNLRR